MRWRHFALGLPLLSLALLPHVACTSSDDGIPEAPGPFGNTPAVNSKVQIANLSGPVDVIRDKHGMVHIYATSAVDAMRVQGYQIARDRTAQLELIRRNAEGRMAELFGNFQPGLIDSDIVARTVGLRRVAQQMYDKLDPASEEKAILDAYADGISQFNARLNLDPKDPNYEGLPASMVAGGLSPKAFVPWTGVDVLAVGRLQSEGLSFTAQDELQDSEFIQVANAVFPSTAADPLMLARSHMLVDTVKFKPLDPAQVLPGFPNDGQHTMSAPLGAAARQSAVPKIAAIAPDAFARTRPFFDAARDQHFFTGDRFSTGSNNWVVAPSRTATGHAMLASDPHLSLSAPAVFWMVQINVVDPKTPANDLNVRGLAFPGIPGIILGNNDHVAWGATVAEYDVTDVYHEKISSDGSGVVFNGQNVPFQKIHEDIAVAGSPAPLGYDVLDVPHHGPILPTIRNHQVVAPSADPAQGGAFSIKWTGLSPTNDLAAVLGFMRAKNVEDARTAIRNFAVGAQNWVFADTDGNIFYSSQSQIPKRQPGAVRWDPSKFSGILPCFVLPGDGSLGNVEWTGDYIDEAYIPHVKNPAKGYVVTANNDQTGSTEDNDPSNDKLPNGDPVYLTGFYDVGYRAGRIQSRIESVPQGQMTLDEMASIQADTRSPFGAALTPRILQAIDRAQSEHQSTTGRRGDLNAVVDSARYDADAMKDVRDTLANWQSQANYDAAAGIDLDTNQPSTDAHEMLAGKAALLFNVWLTRMAGATFEDEFALMRKADPNVVVNTFGLRTMVTNLLTADPATLQSKYDGTTPKGWGDSVLFDDIATTDIVESADERIITSMLDTLDYLKNAMGADRTAWRWGKVHTLQFTSLVPLWSPLSIPATGSQPFPAGFPRHGDGSTVDVANYSLDSAPDLSKATFNYSAGPTQRFVIDMDPAGPKARNALPGGEVWDETSPHFSDEAELWRRNQNHDLSFQHEDVKAEVESRVIYSSSP